MIIRAFASAVVTFSLAWPLAAHAQQPWVDAGQQAMVQHYNNMIEQQSAPDQEDAAQAARAARDTNAASRDERCDREAVKARLRPEYERRARAEGTQSANTWLQQRAQEAGRYAAQNC